MKKPKMILFDYGHTLCHEAGFDGIRATEAIMKHAVRNGSNMSVKEISAFEDNVFNNVTNKIRDADIEVHNLISNRFMYEYLQIEFSLPPDEVETLYLDNASTGQAMPNVEKVLDYLGNNGIRSGVISNISFSGATLAKRINRILPGNSFEFIIASSEYMYRKPNKMIFELALRKAGLGADEVWFCGDSVTYDVAGARGAGIFPVWFHSHIERDYGDKSLDVRPEYEHLYIRDWLELIEALEGS